MQISNSALQQLQSLLTPSGGGAPNYPAAYQLVLNDLQTQITNVTLIPSSDDEDVLRWLQIAEQINSGQVTEAALGVRVNNAVAEKIENNQDINIFGQQEQASSNAVAASFFQRVIGASGVVPPFSGSPTAIMFIDAQAGLGSLNLGPEAWAGAIPSALVPSFWTGFNGDNYTSTLTTAQSEQAILFHGVTATALAAYYAGQAAGLNQAELNGVVQDVIDTTANGLQKTASNIANAYQNLKTSISNGVTAIEGDFQNIFNNIGGLISGSDTTSQVLTTDQTDDESIFGDNSDLGSLSDSYDIGPGLDISLPSAGPISIDSGITNSDGSSTVTLYNATSEAMVATISISSEGGSQVSIQNLLAPDQNALVANLVGGSFNNAQLTDDDGVEVDFSLTTATGATAAIANPDGSVEFGLDTGNSFYELNKFLPGDLVGDAESVSVSNGGAVFTTDIGGGQTTELAADYAVTGVSDEYNFTGSAGTLKLDDPSNLLGNISNFIPGDTIDLAGVTATNATISAGNVLTILDGTEAVASLSLDPDENFAGAIFECAPDGAGGTDISQSDLIGSYDGNIVAVEAKSGSLTVIGDGDGFANYAAAQNGYLFFGATSGSSNSADAYIIYTVDLSTGEIINAAYTDIGDISSDNLTGELVGIDSSGALADVNPITGAATPIGTSIPGFSGLYYEAAVNGDFYFSGLNLAKNGFSLYKLDVNTGTILSSVPITAFDVDIHVDDVTGEIVGANGIINPETGALTTWESISPLNGGLSNNDGFVAEAAWGGKFYAVVRQEDPNSGNLYDVLYTIDLKTNEIESSATIAARADGLFNLLVDESTDNVFEVSSACFAAGTRILTPRGEVAVDDLRAEDIIITNSGHKPSIKWIGKRRLDLSRHPHPEKAQPIRFEADCFADDVPTRDLFLSPDHALYIDGILVPAKALINGENIRQLTVPTVTYYHIELDEHSVIFAENTPAETYLETGNRGAFENCTDAMTLHPDFAQTEREAKGCAPFMESGTQVEAIRKRILERANIQTTDDPALTVQYRDGSAIIQSRHAIPGLITPDPRDRRRLGVKVASIVVGGRHISFDHPALVEGWHDCEPDGRWTNGSAVIPAELLAGANDVSVILAATLPYPVAA